MCYDVPTKIEKGRSVMFVLLDMEHGTTTFETLPHLIRAANVAGVCPVVRVPRGSDIWIDQALDVGAGGVMIPQIDTA